jgi:thioredoxin reductase
MAKAGPLRIAVLGAGPVGLEATLYAKALGLSAAVYEAGQVAEHVQRWGHVRMFSPFGMNATPLGRHALFREKPTREFPADTDLLTGREFREAYLVPLAESLPLKDCVHTQSVVLTVGRAGWRKSDPADPRRPLPPFRLLVRTAQGQERFETADAVLDCTGTYAKPNWAGDGGIPALGEIAGRPQIAYWQDDIPGAKRQHYEGRSTLVVGGGFSAATTVSNLSALGEHNPSTWVVWLTHAGKTQPLPRVPNDPLRERDRLAVRANSLACRCDGNLEYHAQARVEEITSHGPDQGFRVTARVAGQPRTWDVERVVANVGYRPDVSLWQELRIAEPAGEITTGEPGYFVLGAKARGRDSGFLLADAKDQIRRAFALLTGQARLDLYAAKAA